MVYVVQCSDGIGHDDGCVAIFAARADAERHAEQLNAAHVTVDHWVKATPVIGPFSTSSETT